MPLARDRATRAKATMASEIPKLSVISKQHIFLITYLKALETFNTSFVKNPSSAPHFCSWSIIRFFPGEVC